MRLLFFTQNGDLTWEHFHQPTVPYAVLSHTWESEEVSFVDLKGQHAPSEKGYNKIMFCGEQARRDGLRYFWVDSCCIDKRDHTEVTEAINSMFRWNFARDFSTSRWFTRGWTLQELLAPEVVEFYSADRKLIGNKASLEEEIHRITSIPVAALQGQSLSEFTIEERWKWADGRMTTIPEDRAYCLSGIFGVFMSPIRGEGEEHAFQRLKEEIEQRERRLQQRAPKTMLQKMRDSVPSTVVAVGTGAAILVLGVGVLVLGSEVDESRRRQARWEKITGVSLMALAASVWAGRAG